MKEVTIDRVRVRIAHIESLNARGVGTKVEQQQFELACLRELLELLAVRKERERAQPMFYVDGNAAKRLLRGYTRFATMTVEPKPGLSLPLYIAPPPVPVVPDVAIPYPSNDKEEIAYNAGWNAFRAAMLNRAHPGYLGVDFSTEPDRTVEVRYFAPEGWRLVPIEPTQEMIDAHVEGVQSGGMQKGYRAMLAAAPAPGKEG